MKHCYPGSLVLWFTNNTHFLLLKTVHRAWYTGKVHKRCTAFIFLFIFLFIANCLINNYDASSVKATTDWGENGNLWKVCLMESAEKKSLECVLGERKFHAKCTATLRTIGHTIPCSFFSYVFQAISVYSRFLDKRKKNNSAATHLGHGITPIWGTRESLSRWGYSTLSSNIAH